MWRRSKTQPDGGSVSSARPVGFLHVVLGAWTRRLLAATVGLALLLAVSFIPFVWPSDAEPRHADAVVIVSGDHGERFSRAERLLERGVASTLVFVGTIDRGDDELLCRDGWKGREVVCLRPQPDNTREEARATAELARRRGWKELVVVTSTYHVPRTALLFKRCVEGKVWTVGESPPLSSGTVRRLTVREWFATAYFRVFKRAC